ncbi:nitronate monooxygenase [Streptococcus chenjunshii]|uniref:Probable nitronate monooxygenase n=1 Tax=Streptococcus chenjunshii TaxID=2173853 RepID=A0A372KKE9_9STRE|nr:nitronate monooxygenase [Streptococcus chenjunshii]AXQ77885.1 nitronate monooxygenase [Streptococcus chenjunshii]RFU50205.1 nitronate monooxygenase [Streptococcus chenjunshii]RFU52384.1 nitronate monooxygenase [Streptococcus chenjunshii]
MKNRVTDILGIEKPIIQAPMFWLTNAALVSAVSEAGGLGILGPNAGQKTVTASPEETAEGMRREIQKVKAATQKPFGVNIIVSDNYDTDIFTPPMLKVITEEHVPAVSYVGKANKEIFDLLKAHGIKIIFRDLEPSAESAQTAELYGADIIVATGFDEGGTLPSKVLGTFSIVPLLADSVSVPVLAAGGITDSRTVKAAMALGAEGVYCGSVFIASQESQAAENVKEAIVAAEADELLLFRTVPAYYRSLPGELAHRLLAMDKAGKSEEEINSLMKGTSNMRVGMLNGDMDQGYVSVGTGISLIHEIRPAKEIVAALLADG